MDKILIIAEKPSLAKNIVAAIKPSPTWVAGKGKTSGYYEGTDYIVTYAFGHLLHLFYPEDYNPEYKKWDIKDLPICPQKFKYKVKDDEGVKTQLELIHKLACRRDVKKIINAGDSDREGEIIIRNILAYIGNNKPVLRLWMPDQTAETIANELANIKMDSDYDNLAREGYARTYIDWLYGINLSRLASIKTRQKLRVGRVTTPIVVTICERERAIRNFKPKKYWIAVHNEDLRLVSQYKFATEEDCKKLVKKYNGLETKVANITKERKTIARPKLFTLSDLQGEAGKLFKYSPQKTLDALQYLYEKGYVSYPRTNSRYLATAEKNKMKMVVAALKKSLAGFDGISFIDSKSIFDDTKIEAHSALTPTTSIPDLTKLSTENMNVYTLIAKRFAAAFCTEDYVVDKTIITISNSEEDFILSTDTTINPGFTVFEPVVKRDKNLPVLHEGDLITPKFATEEHETEPPSHFTVESLNNFLKRPYSTSEKNEYSDDEEMLEIISGVEIGTEATRAGLIDAAIKSNYITLSKNRYSITELGEYYTDSLKALGIDMTKTMTLNLSKSLKQVFRGEKTVKSTVSDALSDISGICAATT